MQLGDSSTVLENSSGHNKPAVMAAAAAAPPEAAAAHEGINGGGEMVEVDGNSGEEKGREGGGDGTGDKMMSFGGNRWPRQETLALLKIRSDMDAVFRDSSLKGPLWEDVSRKLAELGYHRNAKKCKEKFENVYKYHKRTKESRSGKSEGKTYKFFDQLEALQNQFTISYPPKPQPILATTTNTMTLPTTRPSDSSTAISYVTTFPSTNPTIISPSPQTNATTTTTTTSNPRNPSSQGNNNNNNVPYNSLPNMNLFSTTTTSTSSSTASDEDLEERYRKKRKWKDYFRRLTKKVLAKQEEMQKKFLEAIDKRERERVAKQDTWRMQEMARINRENEILVQERSAAAAKDAAVIAFLQKLSGHQNPTQNGNFLQIIPPPQPVAPQQVSHVESHQQLQPRPQLQPQELQLVPNNNFEIKRMNNGHSVTTTPPPILSTSSRWPRGEVHALIKLRTSLEVKYQGNGPKSPMWEEISAEMRKLGYNRSAKRCKQKWENINKYFKKVRESKRQRREDSKTCPYYDELDAIYKEKSKNQNPFGNSLQNMKPNEMMEPLMVQPEQQWRPPSEYEKQQPLEEGQENNASQHQENEEEHDDEGDDFEEEDGDSVEDEEASPHDENGTNKVSSMDTVE